MKAITILIMTTILVIILSVAGCGQEESQLILPEDQYFMAATDIDLMSETGDEDAIQSDILIDSIGQKIGYTVFKTTWELRTPLIMEGE